MTGPRLNSQRQYPYRRRMSKDDHLRMAKQMDDEYRAKNPEKQAILDRWNRGEISGIEANLLIEEINAANEGLEKEVERERPETEQ